MDGSYWIGIRYAAAAPGRHVDALRHDEVEALARAELVWVGEKFGWRWSHGGDLDGPLRPVVHPPPSCLLPATWSVLRGALGAGG